MDPDQIVIAQIAPAVRAAWGEGFGLSTEQATVGKMVSAARQIGFDYIFDTDFSADLTIMEEGHELLERLSHEKDAKMPMFTSCCPGWVRFMKSLFPDYVAADVRCCHQNLFCTEKRHCTGKYHLCFHHALYCQKV